MSSLVEVTTVDMEFPIHSCVLGSCPCAFVTEGIQAHNANKTKG